MNGVVSLMIIFMLFFSFCDTKHRNNKFVIQFNFAARYSRNAAQVVRIIVIVMQHLMVVIVVVRKSSTICFKIRTASPPPPPSLSKSEIKLYFLPIYTLLFSSTKSLFCPSAMWYVLFQ